MKNEIKTTESRIEYVMTHNFDDIKQSRYMDDIRKAWDIGWWFGCEGEKKDNACIACDQVASFFLCDYNVYGNVVKDDVYKLIDTKFNGLFTFEEIILPLIIFIYERLPLSDYDFREILSNYGKIDLDYDEVREIYDSTWPTVTFSLMVGNKLISKLNGTL